MTSKNAPALKARVMEYLDQHVGLRVYLRTMASDLGETERRVQQCMNVIMNDGMIPLNKLVTGQVWDVIRPVELDSPKPDSNSETNFVPKPRTNKDSRVLFEQVGSLKNGMLILEREDGVLFSAEELK